MEAPHRLDTLPAGHVLVERSDMSSADIENSQVFLRNYDLVDIPPHTADGDDEVEEGIPENDPSN